MSYNPNPTDLSGIELPEELLLLAEELARNTHDVWAKARIEEGWVYGEKRDGVKKTTPLLVSYQDLPESEKEYDRATALSALKLVLSKGYRLVKD
ncbi:MAG: Ryanodine receptor Ryr [Clostridium sp.]|jgi:ryanodine receptor 2|nr:Ryanodine receptor Ryr [Clostridium sp.]